MNKQWNKQIETALEPIARRIMTGHFLTWLLRGLAAGLVTAVLFLALSFLFPWVGVGKLCWQVIGVAFIAVLVLAYAYRPDLWEIACMADSKGLKERISTALELSGEDSPMVQKQRNDALTALKSFDLAAAFPFIFPRREAYVLSTAVLLAAFLLVFPNPQQAEVERQMAINKEIIRQEKNIAEVKKEIEKNNSLTPDEDRIEALKSLEELEQDLKKAANLKEALQALAQSEEKLGKGKQGKQGDGSTASSWEEAAEPSPCFLEPCSQAQRAIQDSRRALLAAANGLPSQMASSGGTPGSTSNPGNAGTAANSSQGGQSSSQSSESGGSSSGSPGGNPSTNSPGGSQGMGDNGSMVPGSGSGAGTGTGTGSGTGMGSGSGTGTGAGAGMGSSNGSNSSRTQSSTPDLTSAGGDLAVMKYRDYEKIFDPERIGRSGESSYVQGQAGEGPQQTMETSDSAIMPGSMRPYQEVIAHYSQTARESLGRQPIPAGMSEVVRQYFSSLEE